MATITITVEDQPGGAVLMKGDPSMDALSRRAHAGGNLTSAEWLSEAMADATWALARAYSPRDEEVQSSKVSAARTALRAHLARVPMGSPVAETVMDLCADHEGPVEALAFLRSGTFLYTKPEGME